MDKKRCEGEKEWYIIHVFTGYEQQVKKYLEEEIEKRGLTECFERIKTEEKDYGYIVVPMRQVTKLSPKGPQQVEKKLYPGYVLVRMVRNEDTLRLIATAPRVMGFLGSKAPHKISEEEAERILSLMERGTFVESEIPFMKGQAVKIIDGPFTDFSGIVEEVYPDRERLRVTVTIFGRSTPVELSFSQVQPL
ncbi:transcription termination/antitermination factor NusG [bacterium]|nr:MAG: transcription termination/antitermination factor NusG [bacterium]